MVDISLETVVEFRKVLKEECWADYSNAEAWEATHNLLGAFDWLLK
jgi:hypothetical protein